MTTTQAEAVIVAKVNRSWQGRALDMFRHMVISNTTVTTISGLRIAGDWPLRGSITFTRDADGKRCRLWLHRRKTFKAIAA